MRLVYSHRVCALAVEVAQARVQRVLSGCPAIAENLRRAGAELHIIAECEAVTDLPMYRHRKGKPFEGPKTMDERGRGYGGLHACTAEESLLELPSARHGDHRDVTTHELAHQVFDFGLDQRLQDRVRDRYEVARALWRTTYAGTNVHEFFAELSMWWFGSRGDFGGLPAPRAGRDWLMDYDPASADLLRQIYDGRDAPEPLSWTLLEPLEPGVSLAGARPPARVVFVNRTQSALDIDWVNPKGEPRHYAVVGPSGATCLETYAGHLWRVRGERESWFMAPSAGTWRAVI